ATAGQNLVRVSLVANVPHESIMWRVEGVMQRDRQFDGAERRAGVAAHSRHGFEYVGANFVGDGSKLIRWQSAQVGWRVNTLKNCHRGRIVLQSVSLLRLTWH